ncbi:hypothetical protein BGW38_010125, partial [Lunasporangiospora selenospora]
TVNVIDNLSCQVDGKEMADIFRKSPALWKLYETVNNHPKLVGWRSSDAFKKLEETTKLVYKDPMAALAKKEE